MRNWWYGWEFNVRRHFPGARPVRRWTHETVYAAERDGRYYLIHDRSMLADFICPAQPGVDEENWVEVIEFDDDADRWRYCEDRWPEPPISLNL